MVRNAMKTHVCPWWVAYTFDHPLRRMVQNPEKILRPYIREDMTVMDVGCGMGYFTIAIAGLLGEKGRVYAVDLQQKILDVLTKRAMKAGVIERIRTHQCQSDRIGMHIRADFILAFYMVHEVPDIPGFLRQLRDCLSPGGRILIAEPRLHVSKKAYLRLISLGKKSGLQVLDYPQIRWSRSVVFGPGSMEQENILQRRVQGVEESAASVKIFVKKLEKQ
jgi:2-polyprenyl-3-methyl-5-hydroxy-6-metoxy-1,4-benzoquinol methylase